MKTNILGSALLLVLMSSTASWAAATAEEAARIQANFETYIGTDAGALAVAPNGDAYDVTIDLAPYLNKITAAGFTHKVDAFKFKLTPNGNGTWGVASSGPFNAMANVPNVYSLNLGIDNMAWSGTYNEALFAFSDSKFDLSKINLSQSNTSTDSSFKMTNSTTTTIESMSGTGSSTDAGNGTTNGEGTINFNNAVSSTKIELPVEAAQSGIPDLSYVATVPKGNYTTSTMGLSAKPMMELLAFFVAHPSKELLIKDQAILKEKLLAALPFFASMKGDSAFENMSVDTAMGKFSMAGMGFTVGANGAVKDGRLAEGISLTGLTLPEGLPLPPWSKGLIPSKLNIGFDLSDFDLEAPARKFITEMDIAKSDPVPPGSEMAYLAAVAPKNSLKITIPPGLVSSELYSLSYEGVYNLSFAGPATGNAKLTMKGMDAVIAQLQQAATDPTAQQLMAGLFAFKGIGKANGEETVWDIAMGADGKVLINGTDVSALMGAMVPPPQ